MLRRLLRHAPSPQDSPSKALDPTPVSLARRAVLQRSSQAHHQDSALSFKLANLHRAAGDLNDACAAYRQTLETAPIHAGARMALDLLEGREPSVRVPDITPFVVIEDALPEVLLEQALVAISNSDQEAGVYGGEEGPRSEIKPEIRKSASHKTAGDSA